MCGTKRFNRRSGSCYVVEQWQECNTTVSCSTDQYNSVPEFGHLCSHTHVAVHSQHLMWILGMAHLGAALVNKLFLGIPHVKHKPLDAVFTDSGLLCIGSWSIYESVIIDLYYFFIMMMGNVHRVHFFLFLYHKHSPITYIYEYIFFMFSPNILPQLPEISSETLAWYTTMDNLITMIMPESYLGPVLVLTLPESACLSFRPSIRVSITNLSAR